MEKLKKNSFKIGNINLFKAMIFFGISRENTEPKNTFIIDDQLNCDGKEVAFKFKRRNAAQKETISNDKRNGAFLAEGSTDLGHTYPKLVKGLTSSNYGVYNCDKIYRSKSTI
mgnify:CR=1 FL=1